MLDLQLAGDGKPGEGRGAGGGGYDGCTYTVVVTVRMTISVVVEAGMVVMMVSVTVRVVCVTVTVCAAIAASARSSRSRFSASMLAVTFQVPQIPPVHISSPRPPNNHANTSLGRKEKLTGRIITPSRTRLRRLPPSRNLPVRARPRDRRLNHHRRHSPVVRHRLRGALAAGCRDGRGA